MKLTIALLAALLAGCASYGGSGLVAGQSTAKDVEALMGAPAERITAADGDAVWFYPRQPLGRQTYAVRLSPAGTVRSVQQVLTEENLKNVRVGVSTSRQVRELLGPPWHTARMPRQQREVWEYTMFNDSQWDFFLYVQFSDDGIVREVIMLKDYAKEVGGDKD